MLPATDERSSGGGGWVTFTFSSTVSVNRTNTYLLAIWSDSTVTLYFDAAVGEEFPNDGETYNGWPDPVTTGTGWEFSVYCTYTETSGGHRARYSNGYRSTYRNRYN
jgi:hypothetical protein